VVSDRLDNISFRIGADPFSISSGEKLYGFPVPRHPRFDPAAKPGSAHKACEEQITSARNLQTFIVRGQAIQNQAKLQRILEFGCGHGPSTPVYSRFPTWGSLKAFIVSEYLKRERRLCECHPRALNS
jgi:hypothetical protein